jgi:SAM-dependent methyltransferase
MERPEPPHGRLPNSGSVARPEADGFTAAELATALVAKLGHAPQGSYDDGQRLFEALEQIRDAIEAPLNSIHSRYSLLLTKAWFDAVDQAWRHRGLRLHGGVHVDIGCGAVHPYGRMFSHLMAGAKQAFCLELDTIQNPVRAVRRLAQMAAAALLDPTRVFGDFPIDRATILHNLAGFDLARLERGDATGIPAERLQLLPRPIEATGLPTASVDLVTSNSVLEHIVDIDAALVELARILRPGGMAIHGIDVRDHRWYEDPTLDPLQFLTEPSSLPMVDHCNRLRLCQFEAAFARHGFRISDCWPEHVVTISPELRAKLVEPWRSMPDADLATTWAIYLVHREPR